MPKGVKRNHEFVTEEGLAVFLEPGSGRAPRHYLRIEGRVVWYHVYLAEKHIRPLCRGELVHHKDGNPLNNKVENLEIVIRAEHVRIHTPVAGYKFTSAQRERLSKAHLGQVAWNRGMRGFKHSTESREKMSRAQRGRVITWGDKITAGKTKVWRVEVLKFLTGNLDSSLSDLKRAFGVRSNTPFHKLGGLRKLKQEAISNAEALNSVAP